MSAETMTLEEIRATGLAALARELGPVGMVRFLQSFEAGHGDYSAERYGWLGKQDVQTLAKMIRERREK